MSIGFKSVPAALRVPFFTVEIDNAQAQGGPAGLAYRGLLIGQKTSGGTATANRAYQVTSADAVATLAGRGSMLHRMALAWFACNKFTPVDIGVLADDGAGVTASGTVAFTGPATAAGTISLYLGGVRVAVAVTATMTAAQIADAVVAAINDNDDLPVTADDDSSDTGQVILTFRHKGEVGNQYDIRLNYQDGEVLPDGVSAVITAMSAGTTNPSLSTLIAALGDTWYQVWAFPYTDTSSLTAIENELADRFGPMRMIDGVAFTAKHDTLGSLGTLGASRNSAHVSIVAGNNSPTPAMEVAAAVAAVVILETGVDQGLPLHRIAVPAVLPPAEADRYTLTERNTLAYEGISSLEVIGSAVQTNTLITTYELNTAHSPDESYLYVRDLLLLLFLRYTWRVQVSNKYARAKIARDTTKFTAGQTVVTPAIGKADAMTWFTQMERAGLVQDSDQFKRDLVVEIDDANPNRMNWLLPPTLIGQLIVGAALLQFRRQAS